MKTFRKVWQAILFLLIIVTMFVLVGAIGNLAVETWWPSISCTSLPWEVVVADYETRDHHDRRSGACLMTLVQSVEQADEVLSLAKYDEATVQAASAARAEIISHAFAEARTCDEVKEAWHTTRQDVRVTLRQKDYDRAIVICGWPKIRVE